MSGIELYALTGIALASAKIIENSDRPSTAVVIGITWPIYVAITLWNVLKRQ